ncbi:MAG TPA: class I SAM-dependent methyltransferase [Dokdonella sp.]
MAILNAVGEVEPPAAAPSALRDARVEAVITGIKAAYRRPANGGPNQSAQRDPHAYADFGFSIHPDQGELIYLMSRALRARRVVEFATSIGFSTLYFAAAMRDNGGGKVIGSEIVPRKIATARRHLEAAGLSDYVEIREGDARETLRDLGGDVDFALIDGWPGDDGPTLALQVMQLIAPQMQGGAIVLNDNAEDDYLAWIRDPANGFRSMSLPLKGGTELSVKG